MNGLWLLGIVAVVGLGWFCSWCLCRAAAMGDEDRTGERIAMQNRDWNFPSRTVRAEANANGEGS